MRLARPAKGVRRGRPRKYAKGDERHGVRPRVGKDVPVHVTLRTVREVRYLRNRDVCAAVGKAIEVTFRRDDFRICQISIQDGHLHLLVEAHDAKALSRGMQGFQISAAQRINRAFERRNGSRCRGQVFADRYHARNKSTPRAVREALAYVLGNWRRHRADRALAPGRRLDPYSSAASFDGWRRAERVDEGRAGLPTRPPRGWLLRVGWRRHGLLDPAAAPTDRPAAG
jgi:REP element-mobilizing transposase RayT